ncbi:transcriptional regulator [Gardnerella vaginalis]|uniref:transcriptional regulator n=1 Tax=Gardnerella vaginalis TaxID=2702 RepID=UPI00200CB0B4|nr:transcriptional regulator [Gardnerella vaginalis]UQA84503.1 transcriptional regulator [Gardnerella vaginalis]
MKKEILQRLANEVKNCKRYALNAIKKAEEGKISSAISMLDIAQTAKTCAMQAHEELWKVSEGKLNSKEFKLFADAETLDKDIQKAYQSIKQARN